MKACSTRTELFRDPAGKWLALGNGIFWVHSLTLCGATMWGRPTADDSRDLVRIFDGYRHLAPKFDIILDASAVEALDLDAMAVTLDWLRGNERVLREHIRRRFGVIPPGLAGLALAGMTTIVNIQAPVDTCTHPREAFRALLPDGGDRLCDEVTALVQECRGLPAEVLALRRALAEASGNLALAEAAQRIGVSTRTLQRALTQASSSFRAEQADARFRAACDLLPSDAKVVAIAARLGLSEDGLASLVRARTGMTPAELRKQLRGA